MSESSSPPQITFVNGFILSDPNDPVAVPHGATGVSGNRLVAVNVPLDGKPPIDAIDCTGCLIMPGLVNAHTHAAMSLLRGLADDLPLDLWLHNHIFPAEAQHANPEFVRVGTELSALEMVLGGITTFADGYFHMEEAARASIRVGVRTVVAQGILDVPTPDAAADQWPARVERFLDRCPQHELVTPALFCHSPYLCGPETIRKARAIARTRGIPLFSHVAETRWELDEMTAKYRRLPVEHLAHLGVLGEGFVVVHAVHVSERERELLATTGTPVVHCPEANMKLASGACPVSDLLDKGVVVGIGTDGPASNNNLDLFEEMRSASFMAKLITEDPVALPATTLVRMATIDGARALGLDQEIGSLVPGKLADLIVVDFAKPHLTPVYDHCSHLVFSARASDVRDVMVNGRIVVRDRRCLTIDRQELMANARSLSSRIGVR
jgi:5-methylthioadenosine/S-adenosylhomocysteine deaminase